MSNPNLNYTNLDARYTKPTDVDAKIAAQATTDAGQYARPTGNTAVVYGDSYAAMNSATNGTIGSYGFINYRPSNGWFNWANGFLGQRLALLHNGGITGQTTSQFLARFTADVTPYAPSFLFVASAGVNDVGASVPLSTITSNLTSIFNQANALGSWIVVLGLPPHNGWTSAQIAIANGINAWLRQQAMSRRRFTLVEIHSALGTGATDHGWLNPNASNPLDITADQTHPALRGAARIGKLVADAIRPLVPAQNTIGWGESDAGNYATHPTILASGGSLMNGATGTAANGWQIRSSSASAFVGTVTCSLAPASEVDATDVFGSQWQKMVLSTTDVAYINIPVGGLITDFQVGDVMQGMAEIAINSDVTALGTLGIRCGFYNASYSNVYGQDFSTGQSTTMPSELGLYRLTARTPGVAVLAGMSGAYIQFYFQGPGTFYFRRPYISRNLAVGI